MTPAPGAGHGDEGDASFQGPAQVATETLPEWPKPTKQATTNKPAHASASIEAREDTATAAIKDASASIIVLRPDQPVIDSEAAGQQTDVALAHPKPSRRLNAKQRAQAKLKGNSAKENSARDGTTPDTTATAKSKAEAKVEAKAKAKAKKANAKKAKAEKAKADKKAHKRKE